MHSDAFMARKLKGHAEVGAGILSRGEVWGYYPISKIILRRKILHTVDFW